jgi:D-alanyl-D-alanine carboxypeptidase
MKKDDNGRPWLAPAVDYLQDWLALQVDRFRHTGCTVAIAQGNELLAEYAFGHADLRTGQRMTPRHRFRIASHSKSFTAAAVLLLREQGRVGLDDEIGRFVDGLHPDVARVRVAELLSHGGGITRDGDDAGQFQDRRPFLSRDELLADLKRPQPLAPGVQQKYSNHGYGLLGLMIEEITGTGYGEWMMRNVVRPAGLRETVPDMPLLPRGARLASGHTTEYPFGERLVVPGDNPCNAIAPAGGFVATAADTARFFAQLDPACAHSILSPASRRLLQQRRWRDEVSTMELWYGLGTMMSAPGPKEWFGHTGGLQGFVSRTSRFTATGLTVTVLCNAMDGLSWAWTDSIHSILATFQQHGAPSKRVAPWRSRWFVMGGITDLVPVGDKVLQTFPVLNPPFDAATTELQVTGRDRGAIARTSAYNSPGQGLRLVRDARGRARELWIGGTQWLPQAALVAEVKKRYRGVGKGRRPAR